MSITQQPAADPGRGDDRGDRLGAVLRQVSEDLAELVDVPVWSLDDAALDDRFAAAVSVKATVDELMARLAAQMDDRSMPQRAGASSTRAHLVATHRLSRPEASRVMKAARELHRCRHSVPRDGVERVRRAQACGVVTAEQAVTIATAVNRLDPTISLEEVDAVTDDLLQLATRLSLEHLQQVANHAVEVVDPAGADAALEQMLRRQERDAWAACDFVLSIRPDGTSDGRFHHLPAVPTAILKKALDALDAPRRHPHSPGANSTGDVAGDLLVESQLQDLPYPSRMGRAFCELVEHLPVHELPQQGSSPVTVVITLDEERLRRDAGEAVLDTGTAVSVGEARRLVCNAGLVPAVLGGESKILDFGQSRRLFDRYQRLALTTRDRGCVFPGCDRPPAWCEAHHCTPWSEAGPTDLSNGALVCGFHHHLIHQGEWRLVMAPDGIPEVVPPARVDPAQRPIRHERFYPRRE